MSSNNDKIEAVSGNDGTNVLTIYMFLTNTVLLLTLLPFNLSKMPMRRQYFIEFFVIFIGSLTVLTVCHKAYWVVLIALLSWCYSTKNQFLPPKSDPLANQNSKTRNLASLTIFRAYCMMLSIICILAVDFPAIFPKYFTKTETFGFSLMDVGVGIIIFGSGASFGFSNRIKSSWSDYLQVFLLIFIGCIRMITVRSLEYHQHFSEYGIHWNFFFTLAIINLVKELFLRKVNSSSIGVLFSVLVMLAYEYKLSNGLEEFIMTARHEGDFWQMNREGICSTIGYLSIFSLSSSYSKQFIKNSTEKIQVQNLAIASLASGLTFFLYELVFGKTSRRLANTGYVLWMCSLCFYCWLLISLCCLRLPKLPKILAGLNKHQFYVFLLANLITGAVNIKIDTLKQNAVNAFGIMTLYLLVLCTFIILTRMSR